MGKFGDVQRDIIGGINNAFKRSDNVFEFIDRTDKGIGTLLDSATRRKRENLDFIVGDTGDDLRTAQADNAALAAGNFSGFLDSLRAETLGVLAGTEGRPIGAFENLSARNQLVARSRGLSNSLALNDFFAREGTVDPPSPLSVFGAATGVAEFEAREDAEQLAFRERQIERELGLESRLFGLQLGINEFGVKAEAGALAGATADVGIGAFAAGAGLQGFAGALGVSATALNQRDVNSQLLAQNSRALSIQEDRLAFDRQNSVALIGGTGP